MTHDLSTVQVRLVQPDELPELREVRLSALAYSSHLAVYLEKEANAGADFWRERAGQGASGIRMATFVAVERDAFVGVVDGFLAHDGKTAEIGGMWVHPQHRGRGLGRRLLTAICGWARERSAVQAGLWVSEANVRARPLYERNGFQQVEPPGGAMVGALRLEKML
jgi:GNAT superfamily N-acetyltransferase